MLNSKQQKGEGVYKSILFPILRLRGIWQYSIHHSEASGQKQTPITTEITWLDLNAMVSKSLSY